MTSSLILGLIGRARQIQLIAHVTPRNAEAERARLLAAFGRGRPCLPRWEYAPRDGAELEEALREASGQAQRLERPLRELVTGRIEEMRLEIAVTASVGRRALGELSRARYGVLGFTSPSPSTTTSTSTLTATATATAIESDCGDPRSLVSQMRGMIGQKRAPFAVKIVDGLGALAATGERTVYVARGRLLTETAARRVAVHEVLGHVMPRMRAEGAHPIFALGTARGTDDQEGLALLHEERAGLLDGTRQKELERRHVAAVAMREGADFVEVTRRLGDLGATPTEALAAAARVFRGSDGAFPGLGREIVYLPALARVREHLRKRPRDEALLSSGQVAVGDLRGVRRYWQARPWPPATSVTV